MPPCAPRAVLATLSLWAAFVPSASAAETNTARVLLISDGVAAHRALEEAILAHLHDLAPSVAVESVRAPAATAATARTVAKTAAALGVLWLEPRREHVSLFVLRGRDERLFERSLPGVGSAWLERVGIVARALVLALLEGADPADEPAATTTAVVASEEDKPAAPPATDVPAVATKAPEPVTEPRRVRAFVGYSGVSAASDVAWRSGMPIGAQACPVPGLCLTGTYTLSVADELRVGEATIRVSHHPVELGLELRRARRSLTSFAQIGGSVDFTSRATVDVPGALMATPPRSTTHVGVVAGVGADWNLAERIALRAVVGAEVPLTSARYGIAGAEATGLRPVQPRAGVFLMVGLW